VVGIISCVVCFPFYPLAGFIGLSIFSYFLSLRCIDRKTTFIISLISFSWVCIANIARLFVEFDGDNIGIGIDIVYMVLTPKIIYFNWHVNSKLEAGRSEEIPSIFDYVCYMFNFVGILTTPIYTPVEYDAFIRQSTPERSINWSKICATFVEVGLWLTVFYVIRANVDLTVMEKKEFRNLPFFRQIAQVFIEGMFFRARYIAAWKLAFIQVVAVNLRYVGESNNDYVDTVDSYVIATSCSPKLIIDHWNMSIQRWLKTCFYLPGLDILKLSPARAGLLTMIISAFWHGFYPTYYLAFFAFHYMIQTEKQIYKCPPLRKFFPSLYHRFILDFNAGLFKRLLTRQWVPLMLNMKYFYLLNFVVYQIVKMIGRKWKDAPDGTARTLDPTLGKPGKVITAAEDSLDHSSGARFRKGRPMEVTK